MKHLLTIAILFLNFSIQAQENTLLNRSFWKNKPSISTVKAEIEKGNDPTELNTNAFDPTALAINELAPNEVIKFLLEIKGNDVNKLTHDGRTYIFWAAYKGNIEIMEYLFKKGAKLNIVDDKGYSPLNFAASTGQTDTKVYDLLISKGINIKKDFDNNGANALLLSAPYDADLKLVDYFTAKGLNVKAVDKDGNTAFNYAARNGNIKILKALLAKGVTFNDNAMIIASQGSRGTANSLELYQYLESLNINPNAIGKNGENVLHSIVKKEKQADIFRYFLAKGVDANKSDNDGNTPLINAAASNTDMEVLNILLSTSKDINQANSKGVTALAQAVKSNNPDVVKLLLDTGANTEVVDANGENIASYWIQSYNSQKMQEFEAKSRMLIERGYNIATPQKNGNTLYHLAVAKNDLELIKLLERFQANVNTKNKEGLTALHKAAMVAKNDAVLKYLLTIGANKQITTDLKERAYELAAENEYLIKNKVSIDFLK